MKLKTGFFLLGIPLLLILMAFVLGNSGRDPEQAILGTWKEVSWSYEKADLHAGKTIDRAVKNHISRDLLIHRSEKWHFAPGSKLTLHREGSESVHVDWKLKGRGHILKLSYDGDTEEYYQLRELTPRRMVLHFENDIHARGIVKIVFIKE